MKEGDIVELLKIGCAGWWFVKVIGKLGLGWELCSEQLWSYVYHIVGNSLEGWAPAAYLEPINRKSSRLRGARSQDKLNEH